MVRINYKYVGRKKNIMTESTFLLAHDIAAGNINTAHTFNINTIDDPDTAGNLLITGFTATLSDYDNPSVVTILQQIETVKLTLTYSDGERWTQNNINDINLNIISRTLRDGATGNNRYFYFRVTPVSIDGPVGNLGLSFKFLPVNHLVGPNPNINTLVFSPILDNDLFGTSDFNPLFSNASENIESSDRQVSDRNALTTNPSNIQALLSGSADPAQIPDSNYTTVGIVNSRYVGSKTSATTFNSIEPAFTGKTFKGVIFDRQISDQRIGVGSTPGGTLDDAAALEETAIVDDIFQTSDDTIPSFNEISSSFQLRGGNITNSAVTEIPFSVNNLSSQSIEPNNIIRDTFNNELMRVVSVDTGRRVMNVVRGYEGTTPENMTNQDKFLVLKPMRFFKFEGNSKIRTIFNSKIYIKQSGEVIHTDQFGIAFTGSLPIPAGT